MKILFIVPYPKEGQSSRFRVHQYLPYLKDTEISYSLRPFCNSYLYKVLFKKGYILRKIILTIIFLLRRVRDIFSANFYDMVFIHREACPFEGSFYEALFKKFGKKVVFDFDDSIFLKKPKKTRVAVSISNCVIVGNEFLKEYALKYNTNVVVLPTCIDTKNYFPKDKPNEKERIIIGWMGTTFTAIYLDLLKNVFKILADKYKNVEFRIIGGELRGVEKLPLITKEWSLDAEIEELQDFDIGVMPMFDDDMAKGKCAFKIIEYMAVGIPAVASPIGMNASVIEEGKDGFFARDEDEWVDKLSLLIENEKLRRELGNNARQKALAQYSVEKNKQRFIEILKGC